MTATRWPCLDADGDTAVLRVAVIPNAKRTEAVGLHDGALRVRLAAPAIEGRANEALVAWLADELGVPRRAVALTHGAGARRKRLRIGVAPERVAAWLDGIGVR